MSVISWNLNEKILLLDDLELGMKNQPFVWYVIYMVPFLRKNRHMNTLCAIHKDNNNRKQQWTITSIFSD